MPHARSQHPNAVLTPKHRRRMVDCVLERGWTIEATAERFQVDAKTVRKWRDRFLAEGEAGLVDRSSRPHRSPNRTPARCRRRVLAAAPPSVVGALTTSRMRSASPPRRSSRSCAQAGLGRLDRGDRATDSSRSARYQRERPGELVHVDVKKIAAIPTGGGWRMHGRGADTARRPQRRRLPLHPHRHRRPHPPRLQRDPRRRTSRHRCRVPDPSRALVRPPRRHHRAGHHRQRRLLPVPGSGPLLRRHRHHPRSAPDPYRPQTNGKIERFHRILLEEWAYIRDWTSEPNARHGHDPFMHFYNRHRSQNK